MIEYIEGNIFTSPAQVIVNTVNTVGVMGKGIALSFKKRYPQMFEVYRKACDKHQLTIGKLMLFYAPDHWVLMFPTKEHWRNPSKLEYLEAGLKKFVNTYADKRITSIAFPKLGCGNGELAWDSVKPIMEKYLKPLPITVYIYMGMNIKQTPEHKIQEETMDWLRKNARDMSFSGLCDDLRYSTSLVPYQLKGTEIVYSVKWEDGLVFSTDAGYRISLSEDKIFDLWDNLRTRGMIAIDEKDTSECLFYQLLSQQGYLSPIRILNELKDCMQDGYQTNEGLGRMYALRGDDA